MSELRDEELCLLPASRLSKEVRSRGASPVEVVGAFLRRIEHLNPHLNAYVTLCEEDALTRAREAERAVMDGRKLGPLHGVPVAIKDLFDFKAGVPNSFGSRVFEDFVPETTAAHVRRLERAGAIVLGKTNTCEFGIKCVTDNLIFGPTSTPFAPGRNAGGSSGGSAAAVAAGLAAAAIGGDTMGSVRVPAAFCGVLGYKPTAGRIASVNRPNAFVRQTPAGSSGPLTRTVEDAALLMQVLSGPDLRDPLSLPQDDTDWRAAGRARAREHRRLRVAYSGDLDVFPVEPEVLEITGRAVETLRSSGPEVEETKLGIGRSQGELAAACIGEVAVMSAAMAEMQRRSGLDLLGDHRDELTPEYVAMVEAGRSVSALEFKLWDAIRTEVVDAFATVFEAYDVLLTPTLAVGKVENADDGGTTGPSSVCGEDVDPHTGWCLTYPANLTGVPAASVPVGFTGDGVPVGLQVIGARFADAAVLQACAEIEAVLPWADSYEDVEAVLSGGSPEPPAHGVGA